MGPMIRHAEKGTTLSDFRRQLWPAARGVRHAEAQPCCHRRFRQTNGSGPRSSLARETRVPPPGAATVPVGRTQVRRPRRFGSTFRPAVGFCQNEARASIRC